MHDKFFLGKKPLPYQKGGNFIYGHYIIFSIFFCFILFYEPQTLSLMAIEKL
jgi:hypothetical protein